MNLTPFRSSPVDIKYDILGSTTAPSAEITPRGTMMILSAQSKKPSWALLESRPMRILSNTLYTLVAIGERTKSHLVLNAVSAYKLWDVETCDMLLHIGPQHHLRNKVSERHYRNI